MPDAADWITPRPPRNGEAAHENGRIRLRAGTHPLTDIRCRSLLVRRQTDFRFAFEVRLEASALPDGGEAGITCYYDEHSFITFGIARAQGQTVLRTREQIGHETRQHADIPLRPDLAHGLRLGTTADGLTRRFAFGMPQGTLSTACTLTGVTYLADEGVAGGKRFTGAMVGVYALFGAQALFCDIQYTDGGKSP